MSVTERDIKLLWGRSGGRCSICRCKLSHESSASARVFPLGEQAHIVARSPDGPRGIDPLDPSARDSYDNLILLCPTHHSLIDASPDDFPSERLHKIKQDHETWVHLALGSAPRIAYSVLEKTCTESIFLHYLDHYYLEMKEARGHAREMQEARLATRLALLVSDHVLVPASAYAESAICRTIVDELWPIFDQGNIWQVGAGASLPEYLERKLDQYPSGSRHRDAYLNVDAWAAPPFLARELSATDHIASNWLSLLNSGIPKELRQRGIDLEKRWEMIPDLLGETAFIVDHVSPLLLGGNATRPQKNLLHSVINEFYYRGFADEFGCGIVEDLVYLRAPFAMSPKGYSLPYRLLCRELHLRGLLVEVASAPPLELLAIRQDQRWLESLNACLSRNGLGTPIGGTYAG